MYKSYYPKASEIERNWVIVDADGQILGRVAARIAHALLGKNKPTFTPGVEMGDFVVVINAERVAVTGTKTKSKMTTKVYHRHSNYPGGYKAISLRDQLQQHPDRVLRDRCSSDRKFTPARIIRTARIIPCRWHNERGRRNVCSIL